MHACKNALIISWIFCSHLYYFIFLSIFLFPQFLHFWFFSPHIYSFFFFLDMYFLFSQTSLSTSSGSDRCLKLKVNHRESGLLYIVMMHNHGNTEFVNLLEQLTELSKAQVMPGIRPQTHTSWRRNAKYAVKKQNGE